MTQERNAFRVGVVTLIVTVTFFVILLWISRGVAGDMQRIAMRFRSTADMPSLAPGSDVLVGGQRAGKVVAAELRKMPVKPDDGAEPREDYYVFVEADLLRFIELRADCKAFAEGPPLGGDGLVKIEIGQSRESMPAGRVIDGADPAGFSAVLASLQGELDGEDPNSLLGAIKQQLNPSLEASLMAKLLRSMDDVNRVTASLGDELTAGQKASLLAKLHSVMDSVNATTAALRTEFDAERPAAMLGKIHLAMDGVNAGLTTVTRLLSDNEGPIDRTIGHVESTAAKLDTRIAENVAVQTDPANADGLMAKIHVAADRMNASLADINTATGTTRDVLVLNRENVNNILQNFKEASDHLKSAVKYVAQRPWRLLYKPTVTDTKQQAIFDAARDFAEAAARLDDATAQLKALAELHEDRIPGDNADLARIRGDLEKTYEKFNKAEAELWKQLGVQ